MLAQGATATMEAWTPAEKPNLSWSHPWATAFIHSIATRLKGTEGVLLVVVFFRAATYNSVLGLAPTSPGFATFDVRPQMGNLTSASIIRPTLSGSISVTHHSNGTGIVIAPANTVARICSPLLCARQSFIVNNGTQRIASSSQCLENVAGGRLWHVQWQYN